MCKTDYHHIKAMRCLFCIQTLYIYVQQCTARNRVQLSVFFVHHNKFVYSKVLPDLVYSWVYGKTSRTSERARIQDTQARIKVSQMPP